MSDSEILIASKKRRETVILLSFLSMIFQSLSAKTGNA